MKKTFIAIALATAMHGCMTEPRIEATKPWEEHYYKVEDIKKIIDTIELDEGESIWMMSNHTLNRLLKNIGK